MSSKEYQIKTGDITSNSEETSTVSKVSYEIENANDNNLGTDKIRNQLEKLKTKDQFPSNLEYVDSYTDPKSGTTSAAFLNKDTGKVIVGMAGTNIHDESFKNIGKHLTNKSLLDQDLKDIKGTIQDVGADANIGLHVVSDKDAHFDNTQQFIKDIEKDYDIDTITGHSLGGRDAIVIGTSNDINNIVVYNPAPLTIN